MEKEKNLAHIRLCSKIIVADALSQVYGEAYILINKDNTYDIYYNDNGELKKYDEG